MPEFNVTHSYILGDPAPTKDINQNFTDLINWLNGTGRAGVELDGGYGTLTSFSSGAGTKISITVTGDGHHDLWLAAYAYAVDCTATSQVTVGIYDGATLLQEWFHEHNANEAASVSLGVKVPAFSGEKTFDLKIASGSGTPQMYAGANRPAWLRATWA